MNITKKKIENNSYISIILIITAVFFACFQAKAGSYDEEVYLKVGEEKTVYLPNSVISKSPYAVEFVACSPGVADIKNKTAYSVTIVGKKKFSTFVIVRCDYYYTNENGLSGRSFYDFKVLVSDNGSGSEDKGGSSSSDSFYLIETILDVEQGKSKQLHYNFYNFEEAPITWSSDNPSVATVSSSGMVTGKNIGSTLIWAKTTQGRTSSCRVNVIEENSWKDGDLFNQFIPTTAVNLCFQIISMKNRTCRLGCKRDGQYVNGLYSIGGYYNDYIEIPAKVKTYDGYEFEVVEVDDFRSSLFKFIKKIILPNSITKLNAGCFANNDYLTEIKLPEYINNIPENCFSRCNGLLEIKIPDNVYSIDRFAFNWCTSLKKIKVGDNGVLSRVSNGAFYGCGALEELDLGNNMRYLGDSRPTSTDDYIFGYCRNLKKIKLHGNVVCDYFDCMSYDERQNITIVVPESILKEYTDHSEWCRYNNIVSFEHGDEMDYFRIDYSDIRDRWNKDRLFRDRTADGRVYEIEMEEFHSKGIRFYSFNDSPGFYGSREGVVVFGTSQMGNTTEVKGQYELIPGSYDYYYFDPRWNGCKLKIRLNLENNTVVFSTEGQSVVSEIYNEEDSKEPAYFNLQGMKVKNPEKGIFIKVVGDKRVKVFLDK